MLAVRRSTTPDVEEFAAWRYAPPYDVYNITDELDVAVAYFLDPSTNCHTLLEDDVVIGFFTHGADARVSGGDYTLDAVDIGMGIAPSRTGRGEGSRFASAVVGYIADTLHPEVLRVTIASGNNRALRVWQGLGFEEDSRFDTARTILGSTEFTILTRCVRSSS